MSKECSVSCPLVEVCQRRIDVFNARSQQWQEYVLSADQDTEFYRSLANGGASPPEGVASLGERRHRNSLEAIADINSGRKALYEGFSQQFENQADAAQTALEVIRQQCKGRPKIRARIAQFFGRKACGTTCDSIPTSGDRTVSKSIALGLYEQGFYDVPL